MSKSQVRRRTSQASRHTSPHPREDSPRPHPQAPQQPHLQREEAVRQRPSTTPTSRPGRERTCNCGRHIFPLASVNRMHTAMGNGIFNIDLKHDEPHTGSKGVQLSSSEILSKVGADVEEKVQYRGVRLWSARRRNPVAVWRAISASTCQFQDFALRLGRARFNVACARHKQSGAEMKILGSLYKALRVKTDLWTNATITKKLKELMRDCMWSMDRQHKVLPPQVGKQLHGGIFIVE